VPNRDILGASGGSIRRYDGTTGALLEVVSSTVGFSGADSIDLTYGPDGNLYGRGSNGYFYKYDFSTGVRSLFIDDLSVASWTFIPEPATLGMLALCGLAVLRRRRR